MTHHATSLRRQGPEPAEVKLPASLVALGGAWLGTAFVIGAMIWPGLVAYLRGQTTGFDPTMAVSGASAVVVIWYTYLMRRALDVPLRIAAQASALDEQRRADELAAAATALLAELATLAPNVRTLAENPRPLNEAEFAHPLLASTVSNPRYFSADVVQALVITQVSIRALLLASASLHAATSARKDATENAGAGSSQRISRANNDLETAKADCARRAAAAFNSLVILSRALVRIGGALPSVVALGPDSGHQETLLDDPFSPSS